MNTSNVKSVADLTDDNGAEVVIDAVGRPKTWKQAFHKMHAGEVLRSVVVLN